MDPIDIDIDIDIDICMYIYIYMYRERDIWRDTEVNEQLEITIGLLCSTVDVVLPDAFARPCL